MHAGNGDITKKLKCASGVLAIAGVAIAVSLIALMVVFIEVYPPYTSSYFAFTENGDVTISLGIVNTPWYSSVTIEQHEDHFHTTIYVVPSSEEPTEKLLRTLWYCFLLRSCHDPRLCWRQSKAFLVKQFPPISVLT